MSQILYFYLLLTLLFVTDISLFFFLEQQIIQVLLCFIIIHLFQPLSPFKAIIFLCLLSLESFLFYNSFALPFFYFIPALLISTAAKRQLYISKAYPALLLIACQAYLALALANYLGNSAPFPYTIAKIGANIILVSFFSLTLKTQGKRGNRL